MQPRIFTDEDRRWLIENYPHLSNREARAHLECGFDKFKQLVKECGLEYKEFVPASKPKVKVKSQWRDENACGGYCMDCKNYKVGGECMKTGHLIGALWTKKCFKMKKEEPVVVKVVSATTKMCKTCGEIKHFTEFWKHPRTKSFTNLCLACEREAKRKGGLVKRDRNNI